MLRILAHYSPLPSILLANFQSLQNKSNDLDKMRDILVYNIIYLTET